MKTKRIAGVVLASSIALTASLAGCSLAESDASIDMNEVIASVNISQAEGTDSFDTELITNYKDAVGTTEILKNELVAYYINVGISYVNSGYSYSDVFNMLVDGLVENAVITQYAIMYLLDNKAGTALPSTVLEAYNAKENYIEKLEYLLTDSSSDDPDKDIKIARYNLYKSLNSAIDSYESSLLEEEETTAGTETRATPGGVDTEQDDYYPSAGDKSLDYGVYTGYKGNLIADSGVYKDDMLDGSNQITRTKAYNNFIMALINNDLVDPEKDALRNVCGGIGNDDAGIAYIQKEYASQLENRVINKYYDLYEDEQESKLTDGGNYEYLNAVYESQLASQQISSGSDFTSTMDSLSDSSFILYAPDTENGGTYGFVYNILLPFSTRQNAMLTTLQSLYKDEDDNYTVDYYNARNKLLKQIVTTDQRAAWFNGTTDYSFKAADGGVTDYYNGGNENRTYLFFKNNLKNNDQYKELDKYIGEYSYNGRVYEIEEGKYQLIPNKLDIDGMLGEFKAYINHVFHATTDKVKFNNSYDPATGNEDYYTDLTDAVLYKDPAADEKEIDYSNFIYASGSVTLGGSTVSNLLYKDSDQYKALAAVNELQYAYTTDTGILSKYLGYSVNIGDSTGYIKEFEYAAQQAIQEGAGHFTVCAGDYGWHLIYVTYTYNSDGGAVYQPDWKANVEVEGTFENLFYEWVKSKNISEVSSVRRTQIMTQFNKDNTVSKYQKAYQDLLDLG